MKFSEMEYRRVSIDEVRAECEKTIKALDIAENAKEAEKAVFDMFEFSKILSTSTALCYTRHTIDTRDEFYNAEQNYYDESIPLMQELFDKVNDALLTTKHRSELEKSIGKLYFKKLENEKRLFDNSIIPDMQEENKLDSEYTKLIGTAKLVFDGKELNLAQLQPYRMSKDRAVRKAANETYFGYFRDNQAEFDRIYDELVKVRDSMAKKLGFRNYVEMGYCRMERFDYNAEMVERYRDSVKKCMTPLVTELREKQRKRIGVEELYYYDLDFMCASGNPLPKGTPDELVAKARKMYYELSEEAGEFFDYMVDNELMDLLAKQGKTNGGYCITFDSYKAPFIFANFNGTKDDVDVLTHEAGHALQSYLSMRNIDIPAYHNPTYDACEIHSMSMELITRPWMEDFFKEDTDKFKFMQLEDIIYFVPYGCLVDEFQQRIYENPSLTPTQRNELWLKLEREYQPHVKYEGMDYLAEGGRWQRQSHIYGRPFYYIDYTLAQICAIQFFGRFKAGDEKAWSDYIELCKAGGKDTFLNLVKIAGLRSPFESGVLENAVALLKDELDRTGDFE